MAALSIVASFAGRTPSKSSTPEVARENAKDVLAQASPALIFALEAWGSVVAHRAGQIAKVRLTKQALARNKARKGGRFSGGQSRVKIYREDVDRVEPTVWQLTKNWRYATRNDRSWPELMKAPPLVLAPEEFVKEVNRARRYNHPRVKRAEFHNEQREALKGSYPNHVIDLSDTEMARSQRDAPDIQTHMQAVRMVSPRSSIISGFLLICEIFHGDLTHWGTPHRMQSLLTWLFAVPRYHGHLDRQNKPVNDIRDWLKGQGGGRCDDKAVDEVNAQLRRWVKNANGMLRNRMENALVSELLAIAHFRSLDRPEGAGTISQATGVPQWRVIQLIRKYPAELSQMSRMELGQRIVWACDCFAGPPGKSPAKRQKSPGTGDISEDTKIELLENFQKNLELSGDPPV